MTTMTITTAGTGSNGEDSYNTGYSDGELAAITKLPARRAHARASMADQYDPLYAQGYTDGYLHQTQVNAALRLRALLAPSDSQDRQ
ncbi:hypothetical protein F3K34_43820 [Streptomyces sp. LBUM 1486]|uniref:hypothetical protein n=1 Tax=Streptomyces scabiei TaxID=1930 RepID=UPI001B33DAD8|nr:MULTISPECIES: hypothetical protein [Streptomyces]MBP5918716.1 hypothetical protein [Streptomyces sp. LBUM 1486]MDX2800156.1 hypothetical protein [Streptomyces scabiei]MDX3127064.1 hypothetical protein [Streptomyces scabiei]MDX3283914.1 hypothetical protein [Streptomyces scabiei]